MSIILIAYFFMNILPMYAIITLKGDTFTGYLPSNRSLNSFFCFKKKRLPINNFVDNLKDVEEVE